MCVIRRHIFACEDIVGGSYVSAEGTFFFHEIQRPFRRVPDVRWRNHYFACNKEAFPCERPWTQFSASLGTVHVRWMSFVDHIDHGMARAPGRWTIVRPRKGMVAHAVGGLRVYWSAAIAEKQQEVGRCGLSDSTAGHGRREQAVPPALVWEAGARRADMIEAARPLD